MTDHDDDLSAVEKPRFSVSRMLTVNALLSVLFSVPLVGKTLGLFVLAALALIVLQMLILWLLIALQHHA